MKKNTVHTISMEGVTLRNYPQLIPGLCLQHSQAIYDNMTAEQRERLCQMAIGIALQGELTRHLPFVRPTEHGKGALDMCHTIFAGAGLDLSAMVRVTDCKPL